MGIFFPDFSFEGVRVCWEEGKEERGKKRGEKKSEGKRWEAKRCLKGMVLEI